MVEKNTLKSKLTLSKQVYGVINATGSPLVAEMLGLAGYDFVLVDGEHGPTGHDGQLAQIIAVQAAGSAALVRLPEWDGVHVKRVIDLGIDGIFVPAIPGAQAAKDVVSACRYPPHGVRGSAVGLARASDYGLRASTYLKQADRNFFICVMIETGTAVDEIEQIAAIDGIDAIQIGPFDLAGDLGCQPTMADTQFASAIEQIERAVLPTDKALGGIPLPGLSGADLNERGYRLITCGSDVGLLRSSILKNLKDFDLPVPE